MRKRHVEVSQPPLAPAPGEGAAGGGLGRAGCWEEVLRTVEPSGGSSRELAPAPGPSSPAVPPLGAGLKGRR